MRSNNEFVFDGVRISKDPLKRFEINGDIDTRIIKDVIPIDEKEVHFPKKVDEVESKDFISDSRHFESDHADARSDKEEANQGSRDHKEAAE